MMMMMMIVEYWSSMKYWSLFFIFRWKNTGCSAQPGQCLFFPPKKLIDLNLNLNIWNKTKQKNFYSLRNNLIANRMIHSTKRKKKKIHLSNICLFVFLFTLIIIIIIVVFLLLLLFHHLKWWKMNILFCFVSILITWNKQTKEKYFKFVNH